VSNKKIRIYNLVKEILKKKNLDAIEEKEKKDLQSAQTKKVLDACKELNFGNKKASNSLSSSEAVEVLLVLKEEIPVSLKEGKPPLGKSDNQDSNGAGKKTLRKKVRLLRRIKKDQEELQEEPEEEIEEEIEEEQEEEQTSQFQEKSSVEEEQQETIQTQDSFLDQDKSALLKSGSQSIEKELITKQEIKEQESLLEETTLDKEAYLSRESQPLQPEEKNHSSSCSLEEEKKELEIKKDLQQEKEQNLSSETDKKESNSLNQEKSPQEPKKESISLKERIALYEKRNREKRENEKLEREAKKNTVQTQTDSMPLSQKTESFSSRPYRVAKPANSFVNARRRTSGFPAPGNINSGFASKKKKNIVNSKKKQQKQSKSVQAEKELIKSQVPEELKLAHNVNAKELASLINISENEIIKFLFLNGVVRTINQSLEFELIKDVCENFGSKLILKEEENPDDSLSFRLSELANNQRQDQGSSETYSRPPVVAIMGHVDHGKTTLLDAIRKSKKQITDTESGGITQHIGAYQVKVQDYDQKERKVTFLDTPGHEAFTALRARGAQVTDLAILVVSADDGVMPQTIEAIAHARASGVPIIIAVNKIDKPGAKPENVLSQLAEHNLIVEDYGGSVVSSLVSAKQSLNLDDLLAKITLVADTEMENKLLANKANRAIGAVIESSLSSNKGVIATLLIQNGFLRKGDFILAGSATGRIRAIFNDEGKEIEEALPSDPVQVLGLDKLPQAGDVFQIFESIQQAKLKAEVALEKEKNKITNTSVGLEVFSSQVKEGTAKELQIIIKSDVQGSAEAVASEIQKLSNEEVQTKIILYAAGAVTENDINLASTTGAIVVNFNSFVDSQTSKLAERLNVPIYTYDVIYHLTDQIKKAISGLLEPEKVEVLNGKAEIRKVFSVGKTGKIAGCYVTEGKIIRGSIAKIYRNREILGTTALKTLKRFKDDAKEVQEGFECGISLEAFTDFHEGDTVESWRIEFVERKIK